MQTFQSWQQDVFFLACRHGDLPTVKYFIAGKGGNEGVKVAAKDSKCIRVAAKHGQLAVLQYLCELALAQPTLHLDPAAKDNRPLAFAAEGGHIAAVTYLCELALAHPALGIMSPKNFGLTSIAAINGHLEMVRTLFKLNAAYPALGIYVAANNNKTLAYAAIENHLPVVQYLCELPEVDPAHVLQLPPGWVSADVLDAVRAALAWRRWWTPVRAAWVGAVVAAAQK